MLRLQICLPPILHSPPPPPLHSTRTLKSLPCCAVSRKSDSEPHPEPRSGAKPKPRRRKTETGGNEGEVTFPRKPRRGRRSEAAAVEDYVRDTLDRTFAAIREQNPEIFETKNEVVKEKSAGVDDEEDDEEDDEGSEREENMVVEDESKDWPADADVGWGIRASEYFESHAIRNVVDENGVEIDWEGEMEDNWVKEINCLEWESFAFHPSPLIVFVFERYNRAAQNWKALKELEKAVKVYWDAKDRLPPRSVKIDINIERDLAYALKVRNCPQILFLRGNRILYREKEIRTSEELVAMIAHFYYNAKRPSWIDVKELSLPC